MTVSKDRSVIRVGVVGCGRVAPQRLSGLLRPARGSGSATGLERLAGYILRLSFASTRVRYLAGSGQVHYRTAKGVARSMDALDWIAQVVSHIPDPGEQWLRYDGWYSNASRGKRRKRGVSVPVEAEVQDTPQPDSDGEHFARQRRRGPGSSKGFTKSTHFVVPTVAAKCKSSPGSSNRR